MLKKILSFIMFILLVTDGAAQTQVTVTYSSRGKQYFTISLPDNWRLNAGVDSDPAQMAEGEKIPARLITAMPGDGTPLWFGMWVPPDMNTIKAAKEYMDALGIDLLTDMVTMERKSDHLNGMEVFYVGGTGKKDGETMDFHCAFVQLSPENVIIAIYIGPPEITIRHGEELVQMVRSLRPVSL